MLDMPILKFEKSTKYLQNQLQIQTNNKQLVLDIITNIGLILNDATVQGKDKYESVLDSANLFLQTITNNITTLEQLDLEIKNISNELDSLLSEKGKPSKTKEFYIAAFTNIKQTIVVYSKKLKQLEDRLTIDNNNFNDFITENNIKYNYETADTSEEDSDVYKFTSFSVDEDVAQLETSVAPLPTSESDNQISVDEDDASKEINEDDALKEINIDVDDISKDILSQANVENIVNDYELSEKNEKIDRLTNEFRNLLIEASTSNEYHTESVISLFKEVLPNVSEASLFEESKTDFEAENVGDLISGAIKESSQPKEIPEFDFNGFNMSSIISEFDIASTEGENNNIEKLKNELDTTIDLGVIELPPASTPIEESTNEENNDINIDVNDVDSLLSLITIEDIAKFDLSKLNTESVIENASPSNDVEEKQEDLQEQQKIVDNIVNTAEIENTVVVPVVEEENINENNDSNDSENLSYSEMYHSFYPNSQAENNSFSIDFSSLENSFKEFDKILNGNNRTENSSSISLDKNVVTVNQPIEETHVDDSELQDLFSDDFEGSLIEESINHSSKALNDKENNIEQQIIPDEIVVNEKTNLDIAELFDKQIERILEGKVDNETLLISERTEKIYLPYKTTELLNFIHSYPSLYKSLSDVVKQEFVLPYTYFTEHPSKSRFSEAYNLIRNREGKNVFVSAAFAVKMSQKRNLNPAIIASCKSKAELDSYLYCLNNNKLKSFKEFKIAYEINPTI